MHVHTKATGFNELIEGMPDRIPEFDSRSGNHYWIMVTIYKCDPEKMLKGGEEALLDHEALVFVAGPCCSYCALGYSSQTKYRRCAGEIQE